MNHRPKKRFGQNFLRDSRIVDRILGAADLGADERVLEVGPGLGVLTDRLLGLAGEVVAFEIDRDLAEQLQKRPDPRLTVHLGDALQMDWAALLPHPPYKLVANLPYNISSQILFRILDHRDRFGRLVLMFQKEVGDRLCALPGTKDYGVLSVFCQLWFDIRKVVTVPPGAFFPPPKVTSVVLAFDPLATPRASVGDEAFFRRVVKAAFAQRRKTLRNTLIAAGFPREAVEAALVRAGIDPGRRGETLDLKEFARLADELAEAP
ncbi:MAG: ribosomal RNA small subunit methyltransferase A [Desulfuromonas sp.]|uniref:16S rRNA (adenine(1518)-N(6)/adenine(1519)-N(6))- dimethyltransferase RsmA n=1 Tax=Desulfuromonas sp. TaxID=892 RepID=UPI000CBB6F71|nr:16S rRNA (adenine(1518)-N(6)/adenine(1519)-N(6))-dimethyltransferase RsmA [Desulfuromonas sp.]PLX85188.1 MAG: ribosomal RNA small subunit methyltransferase A [Desulfuromonas sp.]